MAQSRPKSTTDPIKAIARNITALGRRVRDLELRPDPSGGGGGDPFAGNYRFQATYASDPTGDFNTPDTQAPVQYGNNSAGNVSDPFGVYELSSGIYYPPAGDYFVFASLTATSNNQNAFVHFGFSIIDPISGDLGSFAESVKTMWGFTSTSYREHLQHQAVIFGLTAGQGIRPFARFLIGGGGIYDHLGEWGGFKVG